MKKWNKPVLNSLSLELTKNNDIDLIHSESSCKGTPEDAIRNEGKGCSVPLCIYYKLNNSGKPGNGGKCGGLGNIPAVPGGDLPDIGVTPMS